MVRKNCALTLMAVLALSLCKPQMIVAQVPPQSNQNYGTFGNRTLGKPLVPAPSTFGGGIQTAPGGSFLGRSDGSPAPGTPGLQNNTRAPAPNGAAQPALNVVVLPQSPAAERDAPELPYITNLAPLSVPVTNAPEGTVRTAPALGLTPSSTGIHHEAGPNTGKTADAATKPSGGPISIINPAKNTATLSYSLGGDAFTIPPGYRQNFHEDRAWAIRFSPGVNRDDVRYRLHTGLYTFTSTDHGWELYHSKLP
jgi:hypothetical protein